MKHLTRISQRREFFKFLAGSSLLTAASANIINRAASVSPVAGSDELADTAADAINVFDIEAKARAVLPPAHWAYLAQGRGGNETVKENRLAFSRYHLRPRRVHGVNEVDLSTSVFGERWSSPIFLCPAAGQKAFHDEGELEAAKAAKNKDHNMILSTMTNFGIREVSKARGKPVWFQLYSHGGWAITQKLVKRAENAGCPVIVLTVDMFTGQKMKEMLSRFKKRDSRDCRLCHGNNQNGETDPQKFFATYLARRPMIEPGDVSGFKATTPPPTITWEYVSRLREITKAKLVLKGIVTREDALLCLKNGVDGIIVSNHGGRSEESDWAALDSLPEVVEAVGGRIPVLVDSGFRRGRDVLKALALGATAVGIGRPYLWGLSAFGSEGVERVLELLRTELEVAMKTTGCSTIQQINDSKIGRKPFG